MAPENSSPDVPILLGNMPAQALLSTHQWQLDGTESTPNDCTVTSIAMTVNQAITLLGAPLFPEGPLQHGTLARIMDRRPFLYRIPAWFPKFGQTDGRGATPPWGARMMLNHYARRLRRMGQVRAWEASVSSGNTPEDLKRNIENGYPTIIFGVWSNGTPHAITVAGYDSANDHWLLLDPASQLPDRETRKDFHRWRTPQLRAWWVGWELALGLTIPIYKAGTMITLKTDL